jgi:DNA segregation ATPase FtsK/SpoIIIE-like protein
MLYFPTGILEPERVQGVLVETHEVEAIVNRIKMTIDPEAVDNMYDSTIVD